MVDMADVEHRQGTYSSRMRLPISCAAGLATCIAACAHAGEIRIGAGVDVVHRAGMPVVSATLGLAYGFGGSTGWRAGIGVLLARRADEDLGTRLNILLRAGYCAKQLCLSYAHLSHGSGLGIRRERANSGLNFLFLEYRYGEPRNERA
jgi:hypothetical protein